MPQVLEFFWSLDVPIIEGFGMSETTGVMITQGSHTVLTAQCVHSMPY